MLLISTADAKTFRNSYISFDLPDYWNCELNQTEYVCRSSKTPQAQKEAVIILTGKEVGPSDSLEIYENHLKTPRVVMSRNNKPVQSTIYRVVRRNIRNHAWVDGMHMGSEIPNYYTRYVATTKDRIAMLVTFSAHKDHYSQYVNDFFRAIESLSPIASKTLLSGAGAGAGGTGTAGTYGTGLGGMPGPIDGGEELPPERDMGGGALNNTLILIVALILGGLGLYLLLRRRK